MLDVMRGMMQSLKDNGALRFAVITGCLKITKESIFTGMNNFVSDTIADSRLNEYFGFTQKEVDRILKDAGAGYTVESNREHGEGRSDVVVQDLSEGKVAVFEAKYAKELDDMEADCQAALRQMNDRMYAKEYEDDYDEIFCYGISFFKKRCLVKRK